MKQVRCAGGDGGQKRVVQDTVELISLRDKEYNNGDKKNLAVVFDNQLCRTEQGLTRRVTLGSKFSSSEFQLSRISEKRPHKRLSEISPPSGMPYPLLLAEYA
jgi:hypothetical protein